MSEELTVAQAALVLNALPDIGPITTNRLLAELGGDPRAILAASPAELERVRGVGPKISGNLARWRELFDLGKEEARMAKAGVAFVPNGAPDYPRLLREIPDPPIGLYRKGNYAFDRPSVAIVGSRRTTLYGQSVARRLGADLGRLGFCVVSGLARGIDTAAHEGALEGGGVTAAVLGTGIDIIYPPENLALYRRIEEAGAICAEFPFGRRADKQSFAMRNRIVAGMCEAIVVVESDVSGGSMITARFAGEQGRLIYAVPGRIDQPSSAGCHQLIRDGATLLTGVDDILNELNYLDGLRPRPIPPRADGAAELDLPDIPANDGAAAGSGRGGASRMPAGHWSEVERRVLACFTGGAMLGLDDLAGLTGLGAGELSATLMMLELKRAVVKRADGRFEGK